MREPLQPGDQAVHTRDRILTTAARLFSENGYEHTPLSQVAREAQVSKALVLWHFDSKEKLFRAALGRTLEPYFIDVDELEGLDEGGTDRTPDRPLLRVRSRQRLLGPLPARR